MHLVRPSLDHLPSYIAALERDWSPYVEITTDPDNLASQRVILSAGGQLHERFTKPPQFGNKPCLRYRILLA